jgi:Raf kinase inhibitor-like YbhB/YbcL family protein
MKLTSTAFTDGGDIPGKYTCEGADISPPLAWSDVPAGARSLALIVDDPDAPDPAAPKRVWVHWVLYDIPPNVRAIDEAMTPTGARAGDNDWKKAQWGGPCPPIGRHRYFFKLHALDIELGDRGHLTKADLLKAMDGHVLADATLMGTYQKQRA